MTKGIIVVDVPESCEMCEFMAYNEFDDRFCIVSTYAYIDDIIEDDKPHWCPIQPLPEKINYKNRYEMAKELIAEGWNACINEILGE